MASFKNWLQKQNRGRLSKLAHGEKFPEHGGFMAYSDYVKRHAPGQWRNCLRAWLDFQAEKREAK